MLSAVIAAPLELKHDKDVEVYTEQDLTTVRYSGDGRRVAAASFDGGITMWDTVAGWVNVPSAAGSPAVLTHDRPPKPATRGRPRRASRIPRIATDSCAAADKKLAFGRRRDVQIEIECLFHHVEVSPRFAPLL